MKIADIKVGESYGWAARRANPSIHAVDRFDVTRIETEQERPRYGTVRNVRVIYGMLHLRGGTQEARAYSRDLHWTWEDVLRLRKQDREARREQDRARAERVERNTPQVERLAKVLTLGDWDRKCLIEGKRIQVDLKALMTLLDHTEESG